MRIQILNQLAVLRFELDALERQIKNARLFPASNSPLLMAYAKNIHEWLSSWRENFYDDVLTSEYADIENISQKKSAELKVYFILRHQFLPIFIADFTTLPFMQAHRVLMSAAKVIIGKDESFCGIMMPWVQRIIGYSDELNIKDATEEVDGQFKLTRFIAARNDGRTLISVVDYLDYVRASSDIASTFFDSPYPRLIKEMLGVKSRNYMRAIEYLHRKATMDANCFAYHIQRLAMSLHERSVSRSGKEMAAATEYEHIVREFFDIWNALPSSVRDSLSLIRDEMTVRYTLKDYLLVIFTSAPDVKIQLSESDLKRERENRIINCANILSSVLLGFLQKNMATWSELSVGLQNLNHSEIQYDSQELDSLRKDFIHAIDSLKVRARTDYHVLNAFERKYEKDYQRFFYIAKLIFSMDCSSLEFLIEAARQLFLESKKTLLLNPQIIFCWFSRIKNKEVCGKIWFVCREKWRSIFTKIDDLMVLTDFLSDKFVVLALCFYKNMIFSDYHPAVFLYQDNPRLSYDFMFSVIGQFPEIVSDFDFLLDVMLLCRSKEELGKCFAVIERQLSMLFSGSGNFNGGRWVVFIGLVTERLRQRNFLRIQSQQIYSICFERILPYFIGKEKLLDETWDRAYAKKGLFSCFFSGPPIHKQDIFVYRQLREIFNKSSGRTDLSTQDVANIIFSLSDFLKKNEGGAYLKMLAQSFHSAFLEKTIAALAFIGVTKSANFQLEQPLPEVL